MPSSLEIIWSWKNKCLWPYHSNNCFSCWGDLLLSGLFVYFHDAVPLHVKVLVSISENTRNISLTVTSALLKAQDNTNVLAYWLSNTSTLLLLLQRTLKASGAASLTPQRRRTASSSVFGRMSQVWSKCWTFLEQLLPVYLDFFYLSLNLFSFCNSRG